MKRLYYTTELERLLPTEIGLNDYTLLQDIVIETQQSLYSSLIHDPLQHVYMACHVEALCRRAINVLEMADLSQERADWIRFYQFLGEHISVEQLLRTPPTNQLIIERLKILVDYALYHEGAELLAEDPEYVLIKAFLDSLESSSMV